MVSLKVSRPTSTACWFAVLSLHLWRRDPLSNRCQNRDQRHHLGRVTWGWAGLAPFFCQKSWMNWIRNICGKHFFWKKINVYNFECKGVAPIPCDLIASLGVSENGIKWVYTHRIAILGRKMMIDTDRTLVFWDPMFSLQSIIHFGGLRIEKSDPFPMVLPRRNQCQNHTQPPASVKTGTKLSWFPAQQSQLGCWVGDLFGQGTTWLGADLESRTAATVGWRLTHPSKTR